MTVSPTCVATTPDNNLRPSKDSITIAQSFPATLSPPVRGEASLGKGENAPCRRRQDSVVKFFRSLLNELPAFMEPQPRHSPSASRRNSHEFTEPQNVSLLNFNLAIWGLLGLKW